MSYNSAILRTVTYNEYLASDSGGDIQVNSLRASITVWPNTSQRSRVCVRVVNGSSRGLVVNRLERSEWLGKYYDNTNILFVCPNPSLKIDNCACFPI